MKQILTCLCVCSLCGCSINVSHDTKLYIVCYKDGEDLTLNGTWLSNELSAKCDKRRQLGIISHFGVENHNHDITTDFTKKDDK